MRDPPVVPDWAVQPAMLGAAALFQKLHICRLLVHSLALAAFFATPVHQ